MKYIRYRNMMDRTSHTNPTSTHLKSSSELGEKRSIAFEAWFIRHAQSVANMGGRTRNPTDIPLTDEGHRQAQELCDRMDVTPSAIATSSFLRAQQTAAPLLARFPEAKRVSLPLEEFTYLSPSSCQDTTQHERRPAVDAYWQRADPYHCDGPGAESFANLMTRAETTLQWLDSDRQPLVFLVCHELFIRAVIWRCLLSSLSNAINNMAAFRAYQQTDSLPNTSITKLSCSTLRQLSISLPFCLQLELTSARPEL